MEDFEGEIRYALYDRFSVSAEGDGFRLSVEGFSGSAGLSACFAVIMILQ